MKQVKIMVGSDEKTALTEAVVDFLKSEGHELILLGDLIDKKKKWKWVEIGLEGAKVVADREVDKGILFCWSGTGITMAANRIKGARAALCWNEEIARLARKWDDANILCMSLKETYKEDAIRIIKAFLETSFDEEDLNEVHKLDE